MRGSGAVRGFGARARRAGGLAAAIAAAGPAAAAPAASAMMVAADGAPVARALGAHFADQLEGADYGMRCDGATDDAPALARLLAAAAAAPEGAMVALPGGRCMLSRAIHPPTITRSLRIMGRNTALVWRGGGGGAGIALDVDGRGHGTSRPDVTIDHLLLTKTEGANGQGTRPSFRDTALALRAPDFDSEGQLVIQDVTVQPPHERVPGDSWNQGVLITGFAHSYVTDSSVFLNGDSTAPGDRFPDPGQTATRADPGRRPVPMPADAGWGVQCGFCVRGDPRTHSFTPDTHFNNVTTTGGIAGIDVGGYVQGIYVLNSTLAYSGWGIRWGDPESDFAELLVAVGNHMNNGLGNIYLDNVHEEQIAANFFYPGLKTTAHIWVRNGDLTAITGNSMDGGAYGIFLSDDGTPFAGTPGAITGNAIWAASRDCIGTDLRITAKTITGNATLGCGTDIADGAAGSGGIANTVFANTTGGLGAIETLGAGDARATRLAGSLTLEGGAPAFRLVPDGPGPRAPSVVMDGARGDAAFRGTVAADTVRIAVGPSATLPACGRAGEGATRGVTDAASATPGARLAGGGRHHVPVYCDGDAWVVE